MLSSNLVFPVSTWPMNMSEILLVLYLLGVKRSYIFIMSYFLAVWVRTHLERIYTWTLVLRMLSSNLVFPVSTWPMHTC